MRRGPLPQPGPDLGRKQADTTDLVRPGLALGNQPQTRQRGRELALGLLHAPGEPLDPARLSLLVQGRGAVGQLPRGELELDQLVGRPAQNRQTERLDLLRQTVPQDPQRLLLLRDDQDPLAVRHQMADQVADGVRLAGAGRALNDDIAVLRQPAGDRLLRLVGGQRHQQALADPVPRLWVIVGHGQAARLVREDRGEGADALGGAALGKAVAEVLQEAAELALTWASEKDSRVRQFLPTRLPGGFQLVPGLRFFPGLHFFAGLHFLARPHHDAVEAEPGHGTLEELAALEVVPEVDLHHAARAGQALELAEVTFVDSVQGFGLQPRRAGRGDSDQGAIGVVLDQDRRRHQRIPDPGAVDDGLQDSVAPDHLGGSGGHVDLVHPVEQLAVQLAGLLGGGGQL